MTRLPLISVVIPSFNDCVIIQPFYQEIVRTLGGQSRYDWEIIYVDDGSTDGSMDELKKLALADSRVSVLEFSKNFGQQKAFFAGMKEARGEVVVTLDGDFQYEPRCILDLADKLKEGYDLVSGIRMARKDSLVARLTSAVGQRFVRSALGYPVRDFGSVKAFSRFLVDQIGLVENYCIMPYGMAFAVTDRIAEIPVAHRRRPAGRSKWNFTKRLQVYFDLLLANSSFEGTWLIRCGIAAIVLGVATLSALLYLYVVHDVFFFHTFRAITALGLIGGGASLIFVSFIFSFLLRIYRQLLWKGSNYVIRDVHCSRRIGEVGSVHGAQRRDEAGIAS